MQIWRLDSYEDFVGKFVFDAFGYFEPVESVKSE